MKLKHKSVDIDVFYALEAHCYRGTKQFDMYREKFESPFSDTNWITYEETVDEIKNL